MRILNQPLQEGRILLAGDYAKACELCQKYCEAHGFCVSLKKIDIVWTENHAYGIEVYFFNYCRGGPRDIKTLGLGLLERLITGLGQSSGSLNVNGETIQIS